MGSRIEELWGKRKAFIGEPEESDHTLGSQRPADQEDEDWEAKLYEP
jgi:hypothetical protein